MGPAVPAVPAPLALPLEGWGLFGNMRYLFSYLQITIAGLNETS